MKGSRTGGASDGVLMRARVVGGVRNVDEGKDVVETVVVKLLVVWVRGMRERRVVAGSDRRSAGLCRTKLKGRAGRVVEGAV